GGDDAGDGAGGHAVALSDDAARHRRRAQLHHRLSLPARLPASFHGARREARLTRERYGPNARRSRAFCYRVVPAILKIIRIPLRNLHSPAIATHTSRVERGRAMGRTPCRIQNGPSRVANSSSATATMAVPASSTDGPPRASAMR